MRRSRTGHDREKELSGAGQGRWRWWSAGMELAKRNGREFKCSILQSVFVGGGRGCVRFSENWFVWEVGIPFALFV